MALTFQMPGSASLHTAAVDYLTVTQLPRGKHAASLWEAAGTLIEHEAQRGNDIQERSFQGYSGQQVGQVFLGKRDDSIIVRCSGAAAADHWHKLLPHARNVSRLDLQCTYGFDRPEPDLARDCFRHLPRDSGGRGRPLGARVIADKSKGDTFYLGSRSSGAFGRIYDKGCEKREAWPGWIWRSELELKGDHARAASLTLLKQRIPHDWIANAVYGWFWERGLKHPFRRPGRLYV